MTTKNERRDNPRRAARKASRSIRGWIKSALVGQVCSCCGGSVGNGCVCEQQALNPADFATEEA
jgi:hypothetical protein